MKRLFLIILTSSIIFIISGSSVKAHPGRTDDNCCHYCWTNCEYYGLSYGEYHCHDGNGSGPSAGSNETYYSPNVSEEKIYETPIPVKTNNKTNSSNNNSSNSTSQYVRKKYYLFDIDISYFIYNLKSILREKLLPYLIILFILIIIIIILHYRKKINEVSKKYENRLTNLERENKLYRDEKLNKELEIEKIKNYYRKNKKNIYGKNNPYTKKPIFTEDDYVEYRLMYKKMHNKDLF